MITLDIQLVRSVFEKVFHETLNTAKIRTIVKNFYHFETDLSFKEICDQFRTFKIQFPKQIGKTAVILNTYSKNYSVAEGVYIIDTTNVKHSDYENIILFINTPGVVDIIKNNVFKNPELGYVFIIDSNSEAKQNTLKTVILEIFQEFNKNKSDLEKIYPAFVIVE